ncbi:MAG: hypothetical protein ACFFDQ_10725 [Candidatus Thorarchaeota archaeon]
MTRAKWVMKQYWRIGTIRALLSLALGMFVLSKYYYIYIPILSDWDLFGAITLGVILILVFMGVGWGYDEKAKLWNEAVVVQTERYPYAFVPEYRTYAVDYPMTLSLMKILKGIYLQAGIDTHKLDYLGKYLESFFRKNPSNKRDLMIAEIEARRFMEDNPFIGQPATDSIKRYSVSTKMKRLFQVWILRLNYIQSFTGLGQDVLVFAAVYVAIIFPTVAEKGLVPIEYLFQGILFLSVPIFLLMVVAGWFYDRRIKLWSPSMTVEEERSPFNYVPEPRTLSLTVPFFYGTLHFLYTILKHHNLDAKYSENLFEYMNRFLKLRVSRDEDLDFGRNIWKEHKGVFNRGE